MTCGAVIVGAGRGERLAADVPKCLVRVEDIPLILLAAFPFQQCAEVDAVVLVAPSGSESVIASESKDLGLDKIHAVVPGGVRRQDSVENGVKNLPPAIDYALIHDGARVFIDSRSIKKVIAELAFYPAVTLAAFTGDTMHQNLNGLCQAGPARDTLIAAQTPQGFKRDLLEKALQRARDANITSTDEVSLMRQVSNVAAYPVFSDAPNVKLTYPGDMNFYQPQLSALAKQVKEFRMTMTM
ncbi:MAG: hypothetical protein FJY65_00830 [Calditrichaeota bacterium]|nr:hypothetical protein [Calditrichota bacterium]